MRGRQQDLDGTYIDRTRASVAIVLTFVAGYVDAVGWLSLNRVFTAQMSGNMVLLAVHTAAGEQGRIWPEFDAIAAFFAGLVISGSVIEIGMRQRLRRIFVVAIAVELVMLAGFAAAAHVLPPGALADNASPDWPTYVLIGVVAFAMGAQNTSLRMAGILSVFTTHMTGAITGLSEEIIVCGFTLIQSRRALRRDGGFAAETLRSRHPNAFKNIIRSTMLLTGFFLGALGGAALVGRAGADRAMLVPLGLLAAVGAVAWVLPLSNFPSPPER